MVSVQVVTGYIPLPTHPRSAKKYGELGEWMRNIKAPVRPFYGVLSSCWLYDLIRCAPFEPTWSEGDNPQKNSLGYHIVNHQKFQWLFDAARMDEGPDVFVWMDYGIRHILGDDATEVVNDFISRVRVEDAIAIPGCWRKGEVNDAIPCWRFCGGLIVAPRKLVQPLKNLIQAITMLHLNVTKNVTWEVNTLARAEQTGKVPIRWYGADHNDSMFKNY